MPTWRPRDTARARKLRNAATPAERKLWLYLGASRLDGHKFSRQMPVGPFYPDFLCRSKRLIVEIDGYSHDTDPTRDAKRDDYLNALGYVVMRFTNDDVMKNVDGVVSAIGIALAERPTPSPSRKREGGF
ncbi:MAG: hypothetical protein BVN33_13260 [Proteobacteria bacterium ST_bin13]|nr:MAG: hypothetical protein BVN33_13260 [Proteobacteria bacterium ST_bin13]